MIASWPEDKGPGVPIIKQYVEIAVNILLIKRVIQMTSFILRAMYSISNAALVYWFLMYSTVQLKLVVKTKYPFISPPVSHKFPWGEFLWNIFSSFFPFSPDVGGIYFTVCEFCFTIGETQFTNFPQISPEFPPNFWENSGKIPGNSGKFWENSGNSGEIPGNSGEFWENSGEFRGILGKPDRKLFTRFHSFSFVFPGENYISLLGKSNSPDFSSGYRENWWKFWGKKVKGNSKGNVNLLSFHFPFPPTPPPPRPVSIAQYCSLINLQRGVINLQWEV